MSSESEAIRNIIVELNYSEKVHANALTLDGPDQIKCDAGALSKLAGCDIDSNFGAVELPDLTTPNMYKAPESPYDLSLGATMTDPQSHGFLVRSQMSAKDLEKFEKDAAGNKQIKAIYADPAIEPFDQDLGQNSPDPAQVRSICPGSPPLGTDRHVAARLGVPYLKRRGMNGAGVYIAIVDTGVNRRYLRSRGKAARLDVANSWSPRAGDRPGSLPVGHGTMCAYDALIAAPKATLLDIALLRSTRPGGSAMAGLLSDGVRAYVHLLRVMRRVAQPGGFGSLVVNNSWGLFHESWDFPPGHSGRYLDNPRHPFNVIVGVLAHAGADILFAAGNCGRDCPDGRCRGVTNGGIYGANAHPQVTCVAGVDVLKRRVGYSSTGPGRLSFMKPDVCGYTHFRGSGVYPADGGTSAATPVVAGLLGALRSRYPYNPRDYRTSPAAIRNMLMRTAEDRGAIGFDFDYGWGIVNGRRIALNRSLSVMSDADMAATDINELSAEDKLLNEIPDLENVSPSWHEFDDDNIDDDEAVDAQWDEQQLADDTSSENYAEPEAQAQPFAQEKTSKTKAPA